VSCVHGTLCGAMGCTNSINAQACCAAPDEKQTMALENTVFTHDPEGAVTPRCTKQILTGSTSRFFASNRGRIDAFYQLGTVKLGEGAFGCVTEGVHVHTGVSRAVKSITKGKMGSCANLRLNREIDIMKAADHPNIVKLFETFDDDAKMRLVMELCLGGDLMQRLRECGPFPEKEVCILMQQILRPVYYMHEMRLCHRDLKPENFMLLSQDSIEKNTLKLIDFGLSRAFADGEAMSTKLGTPAYSSPQVIAGRYDQSCDLWSCGVIMFMMLSGNQPFKGNNDAEVFQSVKRGNYGFFGSVWDTVCEDSKNLIRCLLKFLPQDRVTAEEALKLPFFRGSSPQACPDRDKHTIVWRFMKNLQSFCSLPRLKRAALHVIAQHVGQDELYESQQMFSTLDVDGDGVISIEELHERLDEADVNHDDSELRKIMGELCPKSSTVIQWTQFLAANLDESCYAKEGHCRAAFGFFDRDGDGHISKKELKDVLITGPMWHTEISLDGAIADMLGEADVNGDGVIDYSEFLMMMEKNSIV